MKLLVSVFQGRIVRYFYVCDWTLTIITNTVAAAKGHIIRTRTGMSTIRQDLRTKLKSRVAPVVDLLTTYAILENSWEGFKSNKIHIFRAP